MIRGTTPTLIFKLQTEIDFSSISSAEVYLKTISKTVTKTKDDLIFDSDENTISVVLSQEETLSLCIGECMVQLRLLLINGTALATVAQPVHIDALLKEGVIE